MIPSGPIGTGPRPMRVAVFASGGGGNLVAALDLASRRPDVVQVAVVVSDRPTAAAVGIARDRGLPVIARDFTEVCGRASAARTDAERAAYRERAERFHDGIDGELRRFEATAGPLELVVLAYARWIHGTLLERFAGRMVNQHPADLTFLGADGRRVLTGNDPVRAALARGHDAVRTSTFLVDEGEDTGGVLAQGPWVPTGRREASRAAADELEREQKRLSDWPALACALCAIAGGALAADGRIGPDGSLLFSLAGRPLAFGGVDVQALVEGTSPGSTERQERLSAWQDALVPRAATTHRAASA